MKRFLLPLAVAVAFAAAPSLADAHAVLVASRPGAGTAVQPGRVEMEFRFNSRIDHGRSRLTLTAPDQTQSVLPMAPDAPPDVLRAAATLAPGDYAVRWQVLATDGHITRGDVPFSVKAQ